MFGFSGVMISIKSIDVHIDHEGSVGVCFVKKLRILPLTTRDVFTRFCEKTDTPGTSSSRISLRVKRRVLPAGKYI